MSSSNNESKNNPKGNVKWQMFAGIIATFSSVTHGIILAQSSIILPQIQGPNNEDTFNLTMDQGSWFASLYSLGCLSGSLVGGFQSDLFGRKRSMIMDNIIILLGSVLMISTNSYYFLLIGRYLGGYGIGSCSTSLPVYLSEISHHEVRGILTGIYGAMYYVGSFAITSLGSILPWRTVNGVTCCIPVITITGLFFCPESPVWLLRNDKENDSMRALTKFRGSEEAANHVLNTIRDNFNKDKMNHYGGKKKTFMLTLKGHIKDFLCPTFWKPFVVIMFLLVIVQNWAGSPFVTFYMITFLQTMNIPMDPYVASCIISVNRLISGFIGVRLMSRFSKKKLLMVICSFMIFAHFSLATHQYFFEKGFFKAWQIEDFEIVKWIPFASIMLFFAANSLGFSTIARMLIGELLPAKKRSIGSGILGFLENLSIFILVKLSPWLSATIHIYGCFTLFAIILILGIIFAYFFMPETKGHSIEEIEKYYYDKKMSQKVKNSIKKSIRKSMKNNQSIKQQNSVTNNKPEAIIY